LWLMLFFPAQRDDNFCSADIGRTKCLCVSVWVSGELKYKTEEDEWDRYRCRKKACPEKMY
jgi:hypothetical protein